MSGTATDRLSRLLAMVPWLLRRQGISLAEAARYFAISEDQLVKDLQLLFVCGTPGHLPDDLIEADWESGEVYVGNAAEISRPIRLSLDEAAVLLASLRALAEVPGLHDRDAIDSVMSKLVAVHTGAPAAAAALSAQLARPQDGVEKSLATLREGLSLRRVVRLTYLVPGRDEMTERAVEPWRLFTADAQWYLEGWCRQAEDRRTFRLDRIAGVELLDEDAGPVPDRAPAARAGSTGRSTATGRTAATGRGRGGRRAGAAGADRAGARAGAADVDTPFAVDGATDHATLLVGREARWVAEYYPVTVLAEGEDASLTVRMPVGDPQWLVRFVLPFGGAVRVLEPAAWADLVADEARRALALLAPGAGATARD